MRYDLFVGLNPGERVRFAGLRALTQPEGIAIVARALRAIDIPAATIVPAFGFWKGTIEASLVVTIIAGDDAIGQGAEAIAVLALNLAAELSQDYIGVELAGRLAFIRFGASFHEVEAQIEALDIRSAAL